MQKSVGECMSESGRPSQSASEGEDGDVVSVVGQVVKWGRCRGTEVFRRAD